MSVAEPAAPLAVPGPSPVADAAARFRRSGSVRDLLDLRDARLAEGVAIKAAADTPPLALDFDAALAFPVMAKPGHLPEVDVRSLSIGVLRGAMQRHGALIVRNFFAPRAALEYRRAIDSVLAELRAYQEADATGADRSADAKAWFMPVAKSSGLNKPAVKKFLGMSGATGTFLSPRLSQRLFDDFERQGLRRLLQAYFRDAPCLSFNKCVLRRTEPLTTPAEWHQDGAFMDAGIQSLNLWVALTECGAGTDSPGMDLIPKRLDAVLPSGTNGAIFDWSVSGKTVAETFGDTQPVRPNFAAGDAIFFDHFNLHATSSGSEFTRPRYAIENWFFPQSACPVNQHPAAW